MIISTAIAVLALLTAGIGVLHGRHALRLTRIQTLKGPDLEIYFDEEDWLVLENTGNETLEMEVKMYVDPVENDRFDGESQALWIFQRTLPAGRRKRFTNPCREALMYMGYHQYNKHFVRFKGWFRSSVARDAPKREFFQQYKVLLLADGWLPVDIPAKDWFYLDHRREVSVDRKNIPDGLRLEDGQRFRKENPDLFTN